MFHDFTWMEKYEEALSDEHPHDEKKKKMVQDEVRIGGFLQFGGKVSCL